MNTYIVGFDGSLVSPGIAIYDTTRDWWTIVCIGQRKNDFLMNKQVRKNITFHVYPKTTVPEDRVTYIINIVKRYIPSNGTVSIIIEKPIHNRLYMPNQTRGSRKPCTNMKLHELAGAFKVTFVEYITKEVDNMTLKSYVGGHGKATKLQMITSVDRLLGTHLLEYFSIQNNLTRLGPVDDIADAIGLVMCSRWSLQHAKWDLMLVQKNRTRLNTSFVKELKELGSYELFLKKHTREHVEHVAEKVVLLVDDTSRQGVINPSLGHRSGTVCETCTYINDPTAILCSICNTDLNETKDDSPSDMVCERCTYKNKPMYTNCSMCFADLKPSNGEYDSVSSDDDMYRPWVGRTVEQKNDEHGDDDD